MNTGSTESAAPLLISGYDVKLSTPECLPNADHYRADVGLQADIGDALPYLNAELPNADFNRAANVLLWNSGEKKYAFRPRTITIAPAADREEAEMLARSIVRKVNGIWGRRDGITPDYEGKKPLPTVLEIFKLLPGTNCGKCGHASCLAFAAALRADPEKAERCPFNKDHPAHQS